MCAAKYDKNGDGVLTHDEFGDLIAAVTGKQDEFLGNGRNERDILQMYTEAIEVRYVQVPSLLRPPSSPLSQQVCSCGSICPRRARD